MGRLTVQQIKHAKEGVLIDEAGLRLRVTAGGSKRWFFRYQLNKRRRDFGLGSYPSTTLAEARKKANEARNLIAAGIDPIDAKETTPKVIPNFTTVAAAYIRGHRRSWSNSKHARQWVTTLKTYARPKLGKLPIDQITVKQILAVLTPIWYDKTETASRVQGRIENILDYAAAMGWAGRDNPARWRGHLDSLLPSADKVKRQRNGGVTRHHPAMPFQDVPDFIRELRKRTSISARALEFCILTAARTGETRCMSWDEIDLESGIWTIPGTRMKTRRPHRVPLSDAAIQILEGMPRMANNPYVFPSTKVGRPISNMAMLQVMRKMGHGVNGTKSTAVPHGFRSAFRDWAGEVSYFPSNVAEAALAHVIGDKTEAAYARGDLFEKRRQLMQQWADWCTRAQTPKVIPIRPGIAAAANG